MVKLRHRLVSVLNFHGFGSHGLSQLRAVWLRDIDLHPDAVLEYTEGAQVPHHCLHTRTSHCLEQRLGRGYILVTWDQDRISGDQELILDAWVAVQQLGDLQAQATDLTGARPPTLLGIVGLERIVNHVSRTPPTVYIGAHLTDVAGHHSGWLQLELGTLMECGPRCSGELFSTGLTWSSVC